VQIGEGGQGHFRTWVSVSVQGRYDPASWWHCRGVFPSLDTRRLAAENGVRQPFIEPAVSVVVEGLIACFGLCGSTGWQCPPMLAGTGGGRASPGGPNRSRRGVCLFPVSSLHAPRFWPLSHAVCSSLGTAQWVGRLIVEHVMPGACQEAAEPGPKSVRAYAENLPTAQWEASKHRQKERSSCRSRAVSKKPDRPAPGATAPSVRRCSRMFGPQGSPPAKNLFEILGYLTEKRRGAFFLRCAPDGEAASV
jgi:hypothetical protein